MGKLTKGHLIANKIINHFNPLYYLVKVDRYFKSLNPYQSSHPIVSIGNISFGGVGKTPMTLWLGQQLNQLQIPVVIINRNYKALSKISQEVLDCDQRQSVEKWGDEACLYRISLGPSIRVFSGPIKWKTIQYVDDQSNNHKHLVLLDDGFQHHAVKKDLEIVLLDVTRASWLRMFPWGEGREDIGSLKRAHIIILTRVNEVTLDQINFWKENISKMVSPSTMVTYSSFYEVWPDLPPSYVIIIVTSFAHPKRFISKVRAQYQNTIVEVLSLPDHSWPSVFQVERIKKQLEMFPQGVVLCSLKDWVKLKFFIPEERLKVVNLKIEVQDAQQIINQISILYHSSIR